MPLISDKGMIHMHQPYNPGWKNHPNFSWNQGGGYRGDATSATQPSGSQYARPNAFPYQQQPAFVTPQSTPTYANPSMPPPGFGSEQKLNTMEKNVNSFMQSTNQLLQSNQQAIQQLTLQMSKMSSQMGERERGTFPSQPEINPRDARANPSSHAQINVIHTLRSGKKVDNQVVMPDQTNSSLPIANPSSSGSDQSEEKETEQITEPSYEPPTPFPNQLKSKKHTTQMEKILEIFKQVNVNVPLLNAIEQVPSHAKFLKDLCTKKRAHQTPKKVFLAANISRII